MIRIDDAVITAQTLEGRLAGERQVEIGPGSKLTPSAQDLLYAQGVEIVRRSDGMTTPATPAASQAPTTPSTGADGSTRRWPQGIRRHLLPQSRSFRQPKRDQSRRDGALHQLAD